MTPPADIFHQICSPDRDIDSAVLESVLMLGVEIAREGREGRKIGSLLVVGDADNVRRYARPLILDPLLGHPESRKSIYDNNMRETLKELAQLDGAFVISDDGVVLSGCQYINASPVENLPLGLGSRHMAAASITRDTSAVAVVVSESSVVRVFDNAELISEIIPELWMLSRHSVHVPAYNFARPQRHPGGDSPQREGRTLPH